MHYMRGWPTQGFQGIGGPVVMIIFGLIVVGVLVYLVVKVSRNNSGIIGGAQNHRSSDNALGILEERFAKGELGKEDFESMRKTLRT